MRRPLSLTCIALLCTTAPGVARAGALAPSLCATIPQLELRPQSSMFTAGEAPDHAFYVLHNRHAVPRTVRLRTLLIREGAALVVLNPGAVRDADTGAELTRELTVRPGQTLRIEVHFDEPARTPSGSYPVEATFDQQGCRQRVVSVVSRGTRHPARK